MFDEDEKTIYKSEKNNVVKDNHIEKSTSKKQTVSSKSSEDIKEKVKPKVPQKKQEEVKKVEPEKVKPKVSPKSQEEVKKVEPEKVKSKVPPKVQEEVKKVEPEKVKLKVSPKSQEEIKVETEKTKVKNHNVYKKKKENILKIDIEDTNKSIDKEQQRTSQKEPSNNKRQRRTSKEESNSNKRQKQINKEESNSNKRQNETSREELNSNKIQKQISKEELNNKQKQESKDEINVARKQESEKGKVREFRKPEMRSKRRMQARTAAKNMKKVPVSRKPIDYDTFQQAKKEQSIKTNLSSTDNEKKYKTKVIKTYQPKKTLVERIEDKYGVHLNIFLLIKYILVTVISIVGIYYALYTTRVIEIEIDEGRHYSKQEIQDFVIKNVFDKNAVYVFLKYRYTAQEDIPFVEYIDVELVNKNKIKIIVYEKDIIGCTDYMNQYIYFDKDGIFVEASEIAKEDVAYVSGIDFSEINLYEQMKVSNQDVFDIIISLTQQISQYDIKISEINFDSNYNVTLMTDKIIVKLGKHDNYDEQLALVKNILKEAEQNNMQGVLHLENYVNGQKNFIFDEKQM